MTSVVILLSDKRSGSTMFQDELCRHPEVETVPYSPHTYLETHWWLMSAVLLDLPGVLFATGSRYDGYGTRANARALMIDILAKCAPDFVPMKDNRALVFEGWEALCEACETPVFFEKSPQILAQWSALSLMLEWINRTERNVKIVELVRNPHGVQYSAAKLFGTDPATRQFAWLAGCRNLLALERILPPETIMRVRYEDLIENPGAGFDEIARFIGLQPDPKVGSEVKAGSLRKWQSDKDYNLELDPAVQQIALAFGYTAEDLNNPNSVKNISRAMPALTLSRRREIWLARSRDRFFKPMLIRLRAILGRKST